jgi:hypothetical protein
MAKRDISGKKYYKELKIKPIRQNLSHHCFIAVRTALSPLDFFVGIYRYTDYLFQLSEQPLDIMINSTPFLFQTFDFQDTLSELTVSCIVNESISKEGEENHYLLGTKEKNTCFTLLQKREEKQLSIYFQTENEKNNKDWEENDWNLFKNNIERTSVNLMGKIDYIFPVKIKTYEMLKPLFLNFFNITSLRHQYIDSKHIKEIASLLSYIDNC